MSDEGRLAALSDKALALSKEAKEAAKRAEDALDEWAVAACPFWVGQKCEVPEHAVHAGSQCIVISVKGGMPFGNKPSWLVGAVVLNQDGTRSIQRTYWSRWSRGTEAKD